MPEPDMITLPISPQVFWGLVWVISILLACIVTYAIMPNETPDKDDEPKPNATEDPWEKLKKLLGIEQKPEPIPFLAALLWLGLFAFLLYGLIANIFEVAFLQIPQENEASIIFRLAGLTGVLGAVVALPLTILRTQYNKRQTDAVEAGQIQEMVAKALELIGSEDEKTRAASIYLLGSIMRDSSHHRDMILKIVNVFLIESQDMGTKLDPNIVPEKIKPDHQAALDVLTKVPHA